MVVERSGEWWVVIEGMRMGPFARRRDAAGHPLSAAKTAEATGRLVDVIVDAPEESFPSLYRSKQPGEQ